MGISSPPTNLGKVRPENQGIVRPFTPSKEIQITSVELPEGSELPLRATEYNLPFNAQVGPIKVGPNRPLGKDRRFFIQCECGTRGWYRPDSIMRMVNTRTGCGEPSCTALSFKEKLWMDSTESLQIQLHTLTILHPEEVQSAWGGTMDDLAEEVSFEQAFTHLMLHLESQKAKGTWLRRVDDTLPFMEGNVTLANSPDTLFGKLSGGSLEVDGVRMSIKELCEISGLKIPDLLLKLYRLGSCEDLLIKLMEGD